MLREVRAELKNFNWSVSAENPKCELVVSLWSQFFTSLKDGRTTSIDKVSLWSGRGNAEFRERIEKAYDANQVVCVVIARSSDEEAVRRGEVASQLKNRFHIRECWSGKLIHWGAKIFTCIVKH